MNRKLTASRACLRQQELKLKLFSPAQRILEKRQRLLSSADKLEYRIEELLSDRKHRLAIYAQRLHGLSPLLSLERGYSYVQNEAGEAVRSVGQIKPGEEIRIRFLDGSAQAEITKISEQRSE